jgi:AraC-like DNA-binding protein
MVSDTGLWPDFKNHYLFAMNLPAIKYLTVNEQDPGWGLITTTVGLQKILPLQAYPSKDHPSPYWFHPETGRILQEFQLIYITEGKGTFRVKSKPAITVSAGQIIMLFPGEWHTYSPAAEGWTTYWVGFKGPFAEQLVQQQFFGKADAIHQVGYQEKMVALFQDIIQHAYEEKPGYQPLISSTVIQLLGLLHYTIQNNRFTDPEIVTKIARAKTMMQEHPGGEIPPEELAQALNISYSWFRKMFRKYTGLAPAQYQHQLKMQKAREWLANTDKPVKEIAYILNFDSPNYFNNSFKQSTGITPARFRKLWRSGT